ncbi:MAG: amidase family protein, partial [Acidimicrobiales bacterium]
MDTTDLVHAGATEQARLVRDGVISARELVEATLARIDAVDPLLNAYRVVFADRALVEADEADARRSAGDDLPLLGVPIAIKDDADVAGEVTAWGTDAYGAPKTIDSDVVARLRAAGHRHRQDQRARADPVAVDRVDGVGRNTQPMEHRAHAGRLVRRVGRGGGDGDVRCRARLRGGSIRYPRADLSLRAETRPPRLAARRVVARCSALSRAREPRGGLNETAIRSGAGDERFFAPYRRH